MFYNPISRHSLSEFHRLSFCKWNLTEFCKIHKILSYCKILLLSSWSEPRLRKCSRILSNPFLDMEIAWIAATLEPLQEEGAVLPGKILFFSLSQWPSSNQWVFCRFPELLFQTPSFLPLSELPVLVTVFRQIHLCGARV